MEPEQVLRMSQGLNSDKLAGLASALAAVTGEDIETAVACALEERLARMSRLAPAASGEEIDALFERLARMPVRDGRSPDEIMGYDANGLPG